MGNRLVDTARRLRRPALERGGPTAFLGVSLLVGAAVGVATALLVGALRAVQWGFDAVGSGLSLGRYLVFLSVPIGLLAAWWVARRFAPEVAGDGVPEATAALAVHAGYLPTRAAPLKVVATALTLGGGGSAGREGPIVQIGAAIGSSIARRFRLGEDQLRSLVAAGAGAGIGASFNAPIAGMLFALEIILGRFSVRHLSAVVVASVAAAVTSRSLVGEELALSASVYRLRDPRELLLYALLGLLVAGAAYLFLRMVETAEQISSRIRVPSWARPVGIGLVVAALGFFEPRILGTGQEFASDVLQFQDAGREVWWLLLLLALLKMVATSGTLSARASGGAFMPSLFIGAMLGAGFAEFFGRFWDIDPGAFAVVGMAATFSAVARAPLTAILIVFEITGARDYGLILPLMLTAILATFLAERLHRESVYTMPLARRGIQLLSGSEVDLLDTVTVGEVMSRNPTVVTPSMTLEEVQALLDEHRHHGLAVVDGDGGLVGVITVTDILRAGGPGSNVAAGQAMTARPVTVSPSTAASEALERLAALGVGRLPVVADDDPARLIGMFRREDAVRAYHHALSRTTGDHLTRQRLARRTHPGADFFDFRIPTGSVADGRLLKEVPWPEGATLVSVRRAREVKVPTGDTLLRGGDVITAYGIPAARDRLIERLNATAEEPTAEIPLSAPLQSPPPRRSDGSAEGGGDSAAPPD